MKKIINKAYFIKHPKIFNHLTHGCLPNKMIMIINEPNSMGDPTYVSPNDHRTVFINLIDEVTNETEEGFLYIYEKNIINNCTFLIAHDCSIDVIDKLMEVMNVKFEKKNMNDINSILNLHDDFIKFTEDNE